MSGKSLAKAFEKERTTWLNLAEQVRVLPAQLKRPIEGTPTEQRLAVLDLTNDLRRVEFSAAEYKRYNTIATDIDKAFSIKWIGDQVVFGKQLKSKKLEHPEVAAVLGGDKVNDLYANAQQIYDRLAVIGKQVSPRYKHGRFTSPIKQEILARDAMTEFERLVANDAKVMSSQKAIAVILEDSQWESRFGYALDIKDQIHETRRACNRWLAADLALTVVQAPEADHAIGM